VKLDSNAATSAGRSTSSAVLDPPCPKARATSASDITLASSNSSKPDVTASAFQVPGNLAQQM
jgi:hypothetical protein